MKILTPPSVLEASSVSDEFDSLLDSLRELLLEHTVFQSVTNLSRLGVFMQHHAASSLGLYVVAK